MRGRTGDCLGPRDKDNAGRPPQHQPQPQQTKYCPPPRPPHTHERSNMHRPHGRSDNDDPTHSVKGPEENQRRMKCHTGGGEPLEPDMGMPYLLPRAGLNVEKGAILVVFSAVLKVAKRKRVQVRPLFFLGGGGLNVGPDPNTPRPPFAAGDVLSVYVPPPPPLAIPPHGGGGSLGPKSIGNTRRRKFSFFGYSRTGVGGTVTW